MVMRRFILAALAAVLAAWASAGVAENAPAFATPDAAIAAYVEGVARRDFGEILAATATDRMYTHFDFAAYVDALGLLTPTMAAPAGDPLLRDIDRAEFTAGIAHQVKMLTYALLGRWDLAGDKPVAMKPGDAAALLGALDLARLGGLELVRVGTPKPALIGSEGYRKNAARRAGIYGADEMSERAALLRLEGRTYLLGFTLLRFGASWAVTAQWSPVAGTNALGAPWPMTPQQFEDLLK